MKKILLLTFLLAFSLTSVWAQENYPSFESNKSSHSTLVRMFTESFDGVVRESKEMKEKNLTVAVTAISIPRFYDSELVRMTINNFVRKYSDVIVIEAWNLRHQGDERITLLVDGTMVSVCFWYEMPEGSKILHITSILKIH